MGIVNIRVCFMNGSMFEHDGLGITYFSIDILKDMVACWYAWVFIFSCQTIDYFFESLKSKYPCHKRKYYMMNMIGSFPQQKFRFQLLLYHNSFMRKSCCYDARKSDWNCHWSNLRTMLAFTLQKLFLLSFTYSRTSRS